MFFCLGFYYTTRLIYRPTPVVHSHISARTGTVSDQSVQKASALNMGLILPTSLPHGV